MGEGDGREASGERECGCQTLMTDGGKKNGTDYKIPPDMCERESGLVCGGCCCIILQCYIYIYTPSIEHHGRLFPLYDTHMYFASSAFLKSQQSILPV